MGKTHRDAGFTLVELMVILILMGIMFSIGGLNFNNWQRKSHIERQARETISDLNAARTDSIFRKQRHSIVINSGATGYVFKRYSSLDENRLAGTVIMTKTARYQFAKAAGTSAANRIFEFDLQGFTTDWDSIRINPVDSGAAFDCIVIAASRTNIGKMEGGSCVQK